MRTVFVTSGTPALGTGRGLRTYGVVAALARSGPVDLVYTRHGPATPDAAFASLHGVTFHEVVASRGVRRAAVYGAARLHGVPRGFARGLTPELAARTTELADREPRATRIVADGPIEAYALRRLRERVTYNAHNLESQLRSDIGGEGSLRSLRRFERRLLRTCGESWMASRKDLEGARELWPDATLRYVPNVVDAEAIRPRTAPPADGPPRVLFLASWTYAPNAQAGRFLLDEVLGRLREAVPDVQLVLAGGGAATALGLDADAPPRGVELPGFVPDLDPLYDQAACVVVPLLTGSGSPLKLIEALAHGVPVVTTPRGAAGVDGEAGRDYLVADGATGLAEAIAGVLRGGSPWLGSAGRELAVREYSIGALQRRIEE